jgi:hypothetical protein
MKPQGYIAETGSTVSFYSELEINHTRIVSNMDDRKDPKNWILDNIPSEVLEAELKRRKEVKRPEPLDFEEISWGSIIDYLEDEGMSKLDSGEGLSKDFEHYLFENVMEIVYGPGVWKWWNSKQ